VKTERLFVFYATKKVFRGFRCNICQMIGTFNKTLIMKSHFIKILLSISLVLSGLISHAQEERTFTVKEGMSISDVLPDSMIYLYPRFLKGTVIFNNGKQIDARLNYNLIISKIQFINNAKDTLAVTNPEDVKNFIAGADTFLYNKVYYRILLRNSKITLSCHQYTKVLEVRKEAGYGLSSPTQAVDSYSSIQASDNSGTYKLRASAETLFSICTDYLFQTGVNEFVIATQKNVLKMFPGKSEGIKKYIKENDINFKKKADLEKLTRYISSLFD
jgi:hypothetical protein